MRTFGVALCLGLVSSAGFAGELKSGPQVGKEVPGPFEPLNVTGLHAGYNYCLYCQNGDNPVAMVFARKLTPEVKSLVKKLDEATAKNKKCLMGSFVVFLGDAKDLEKPLKGLAKEQKHQEIILTVEDPPGPAGYEVAPEAEVTVVLYRDRTVRANHAFAKGGLSEKAIDRIITDIAKITAD